MTRIASLSDLSTLFRREQAASRDKDHAATSEKSGTTIKRQPLTFILRNLSTLIENGVSLPKALATVSQEESLQKYAPILNDIRRRIESGETFSGALAAYPHAFHITLVNQIRIAERTGTLIDTLRQVTDQLEKANQLRLTVIKKLAYPILLMVMGTLVVTFMLIFVVPVFEETYADAKIPLPMVTQVLIEVGRVASKYYWVALLVIATTILAMKHLRANESVASAMDRWLLKLPLFGRFLRDMAVLQFMDVLGNLMDAGYTIAEALGASADSVNNRAVKQAVKSLQAAVNRGERFSREIDRHGEMFPPVVSQLVIVGEQTGNLPKATSHIREHLRREIEQYTNVMVGTLEPILTISLASAIGLILLAIYLPMFDMIGAVSN